MADDDLVPESLRHLIYELSLELELIRSAVYASGGPLEPHVFEFRRAEQIIQHMYLSKKLVSWVVDHTRNRGEVWATDLVMAIPTEGCENIVKLLAKRHSVQNRLLAFLERLHESGISGSRSNVLDSLIRRLEKFDVVAATVMKKDMGAPLIFAGKCSAHEEEFLKKKLGVVFDFARQADHQSKMAALIPPANDYSMVIHDEALVTPAPIPRPQEDDRWLSTALQNVLDKSTVVEEAPAKLDAPAPPPPGV
jgi:hypothetical protein